MEIQGLDLAREYYQQVGRPALEKSFPELMERAAAGLAGDGSECLGFDDPLSRDHDFGPAFCLWLTDEDYAKYGASLQEAYDRLPGSFLGFEARNTTAMGTGRVGVMTISGFYRRFTGCPQGPETDLQWLAVPEHLMAQVCSGAVFRDPLDEFSRIRRRLQRFYPEEVRRKKLAARAVTLGQAGQYNYPRALERRDPGAAFLAMREFVYAWLSMAHLLERRYMPYYKWAYRSAEQLEFCRHSLMDLRQMMEKPLDPANVRRIERLCRVVRDEWEEQGLTGSKETFMEAQGQLLYRGLQSPELRELHILRG